MSKLWSSATFSENLSHFVLIKNVVLLFLKNFVKNSPLQLFNSSVVNIMHSRDLWFCCKQQCCQMWGIFPKVGIFGDGVGIDFFKWGLALKVWGFRL